MNDPKFCNFIYFFFLKF